MPTGTVARAPAKDPEPYQPFVALLEAFHYGDWCSLLFLAIAACAVGGKVAGHHEAARDWGLRLAAVTGIAYAGLAVWVLAPQGAEDFLQVFLRAALAGSFVLGCAWLVLPTVAFLWRHTLAAAWQRFRAWSDRCRRRRSERRARRDDERRHRQRLRELELQAPDRERQQRDAEERARQQAAASKRREDARLRCELYFTLHEQEIGGRFQRAFVTDYLQRYMGDDRTPEEVEDRAARLLQQLQQALNRVEPARKLDTVDNILAWYDAEVAKLARVPEGKQKNALLGQLAARRDELLFKLFEEQQ